MPFANDSQKRACYAQLKRDIQAGLVPTWDCSEFSGTRGKTDWTLRKGPRGGKYVVYKGIKVYLDKTRTNGGKLVVSRNADVFTKAQCRKWKADKTTNPVTGRQITRGGPVWRKYEKSCKLHNI